MKLKCLVLSILVFNLCYSQNQSEKLAKVELVKITDWGQLTIIPPKDFWEAGENEIINQIGEKEFESAKTFSRRENIPCQMQIFCEDIDGSSKKNLELLKEKQSKLKVYKIATCTYIDKERGGTTKFAILRVPYNENKNWDTAAKWNLVYFLVPTKVVEKL